MKLKNFLIVMFIFLLSAHVFSENKEPVKSLENVKKRIIILPFYNYADSELKYLSYYIPELMKKNMLTNNKIEILSADDIKDDLKKRNLKAEDLYNVAVSKELLSNLKADLGVCGRYIIHSKVITIDFKVINPATSKVTNGLTFEGVIDDRFFALLEKYAVSRNTWIKNYVLEKSFSDIIDVKQNIFGKVIDEIRNSAIGIILNNIILANKWLQAILIFIFFYIISKIGVLIVERILKRLSLKTVSNVDERIIDRSKKPVKWVVIFIGIKLACSSLQLSPNISLLFDNISTSIIIIIITYLLMNAFAIIIRSWGERVANKIDSRIYDDIVPLFVSIMKIVIIAIGILMILSRFEIDIAPLLASLGIAGFAIGFAVKDSLSNIIGGIVLILDNSFSIGDKVTIDGDTGIIKEVGLRNTQLLTFDNEIIVIPNGELMNKKFKNSVLPDPTIRVILKFGVAYGSDVDKVEEIVLNAIKQIENICKDPEPIVVFIEMADFSLNMEAQFWVPDYINQYDKRIEGTKVVYKALTENGITIPFPTQTIYIEK